MSQESPLYWIGAHRGIGNANNEGSLETLRKSAEIEPHMIDLDLRQSRDGTLFLFHGAVIRDSGPFAQTSFHGRKIDALTRKELSDLCYSNSRDSCIPLFQDALRVLKPFSTLLLLDIKFESKEIIDQVISEASEIEMKDRLVFGCRHTECLTYLREKHPHILVSARTFSPEHVHEVLQSRPAFVWVKKTWATSELIQSIHKAGAKAIVGSFSERREIFEHWCSLYQMGIDVIFVDSPAKLKAFLRSKPTSCVSPHPKRD